MAKWAPRNYPIRDPRRAGQQNGRIINPPRYLKLGGRGENRPPSFDSKGEGAYGAGPVSNRGGAR